MPTVNGLKQVEFYYGIKLVLIQQTHCLSLGAPIVFYFIDTCRSDRGHNLPITTLYQ
jgi:hypothetical protein